MKFFIPFLLFIFQACAPTPGFAADTFNSATVMTGVKAYKNYVKNPNCDSNVLNIGYTSALPPTQTTIGTRHACRWNPAANSKTLTWKINDLDADVSNGANNCAATFSCEGVGGDGSFSAALNYDSVTKDSLTDMGVKSGVWKDYKLQFPCGDTTSTTREIVLTTTASSPGVVVCRNVNFGKYDLQVGTNSTQEADYGAITIGATTTAPTKGVMAVDKVTGHFEGQYWVGTYNFSQTAATGAASGSGDYLIGIPAAVGAVDLTLQQVYTGATATTGSGVAHIGQGHRYDGVDIILQAVLYDSAHFRLRHDILYTTVAYYGSTSGQGSLSSSGTQSWSVQVKVPIVGRSSVTVVQPDQTDFGWIDGGPITITGTTTNPTKGTTTKDHVWYKREAENMKVRLEFAQGAAGTAGSGDYLILIPGGKSIDTNLVNVNSTIGANSAAPPINIVGTAGAGVTSTVAGTGYVSVYDATHVRLMLSATTAATFQSQGSAWHSLNQANFGFSAIFSVPISGWINNGRAPSLAGGVTSNAQTPLRYEYAKVSAAGVVSGESSDFISGNCALATNVFTCSFNTGIYSAAPNCIGTIDGATGANSIIFVYNESTTSVTVSTANATVANTAYPFKIHCIGPR